MRLKQYQQRFFALAIFVLSVVLTGCATTSTPSNEYLLMDNGVRETPSQSETNHDVRQGVSVQLLPIKVADYLAGDEMVLVSKQGEVFRSQQNLWAEPLAPQLSRLTLQALIKRMPNVEWFGQQPLVSSLDRLSIEVDTFYGDLNGQVHIAGRWKLVSATGELVASKEFVTQGTLSDSGYPALVKTLSNAWFESVIDPMVESLYRQFRVQQNTSVKQQNN